MNRCRSIVALVVVLTAVTTKAREIGFLEDFALAPDRTVPLAQLIPGTEDYYYYHSLHYQNTEQFDKVEETLTAWIKRYNYTPRVREIQTRQALLTYHRNPQQSLEFIRQQLDLQFQHQRETLGQDPKLPTELDPKHIARSTLYQHAISRYQNLQGFEDAALDWLVAEPLDPDRRRHLLERLTRPDYPNLAKLVVDDLAYKYSRGFGAFGIHRQLLLAQLDECVRLKPELLNQSEFVNTYLTKLHPNADVQWRHDAEEFEAYLRRLWSLAERLAPVHNSLKAHVLYHWLVFDRSRDVYNKERFSEYIKLPRNVSYINKDYMQREENRQNPANLAQDFAPLTLLGIVGNDEPLVRSYLLHFFVAETTFQPFERYIDDVYLKHRFAEAKIVNGLGEPEQWFSMLPPAEYHQLKERIDLDFAFTNKQVFGADEPVHLDLDVKNVEALIVKVFEINAQNYYRQYGREVNTDINLDGLVANEDRTESYSEPPLRRVRRHFEFPSLEKPGVYVIDFIGNGRASRAVVRKGKLRYLVHTSTAGHVLTVLDEKNQTLTDATVWLQGHEYRASQDGTITIPFSNQPGPQPNILSRGEFCSLDSFQHESENYRLEAGIYVDRESLLTQRNARMVVRPGLYLNETPVTLSVLADPKLILQSVDHDGVVTTKQIDDFKLHEDQQSSHEFQVPQRTSQISVTVTATVQNMSQNKKQPLAVTETFTLNQIDRTEKVEDLHLAKIDGQYVVDVLGITGEPKPTRPVQLSLKHRDFLDAVQVSLQSDQRGRITLGRLDGITSVAAPGPESTSHTWQLVKDGHSYLGSVHGVAGEPIELAYMGRGGEPERSQLSLLEVRGDTFVADRFDAITVRNGLVVVQGLARGDYDLLIKDQAARIRLRVAEGTERDGYVLGDTRQLEVRGAKPLQIERIDANDKQLTIQLRNATKFARVHVWASRYQPAYSAFAHLGRVRDMEPFHVELPRLESLYAEGRDIGDEYRYIIDRKRAQKFPGNMLERPSLLLNPWPVRQTETGQQQAAAGQAFAPQADVMASLADRAPSESVAPSGASDFGNLDFLYKTSTALVNLVPDESGLISIDRDELGPHQHVHVVAVDPQATAYRSVSLPETKPEVLDLRLAGGLDPKLHYTQRKQISIVRSGETFELADIASSRFEAYDSLARIYALYATLSGDAKLREFNFILQWPGMTDEEKREKYSEYACHELNFFLHKKDPEFFQSAVRPYLVNKKDKSFLDRWLTADDLQRFLEPWNYEQLNIVERILLGQRIRDDQQYMRRHVQDLLNLIPPDIDRFNLLFNSAIQGSSLEAEGRFAGAGFGGALGGARGAMEDRVFLNGAALRAGQAGLQAPAAPAATAAAEAAALGLQSEALADKERAEKNGDQLARKNALAEEARAAGRDRAGVRFFGADEAKREQMRQFYVKLDKTQEWAENNYYHLPIDEQNANLITASAFWTDYADHDPSQPFFSTHLADASRNFSEMMLALSVLDIPFEAEEHVTKFEKTKMTLTAASPMAVYHEQVQQTPAIELQTPILVSQNFFRHSDRYRYVNNEREDKFVTDEFLTHTVYGCQVVVTNPTSSRQKLDLLLQVPVGAIPVLGSKYTRSVSIDLEPFHTQTVEYHFYFPAAGQYRHFPVHVAKNEHPLAHAQPIVLAVVDEPSRIDRESWDYISQFGTNEEVISFLNQNNLHRIQLEKIAFRMADKEFFQSVIQLLAQRHVYNHTLWSYGIRHNVVPAIRQFLAHADGLVNQCGSYIDSPLVVIDPVVRKTYQHLDYLPLVNARAHQLGSRRQILNDRLYDQYHRLLAVLSYRRDLDQDDLMSVTYYLALEDRVEEASAFFQRVNPELLKTRLQHDYFTAYFDFYTADLDEARAIAARYAEFPVDRWRKAFANISSQLDQITGSPVELVDALDRTQRQTGLAASQPNFDFTVESQKIRIDYQNLDQVQVNYYLMDIELLFSRNPFVQHYADQFSYIRPNTSQTVPLASGKTSLVWDLPEPLHNRNVLVEIIGGGLAKTQAYYSNSMRLQVVENYGQLQVTSHQSGQPLSKVYVKAYAQLADGSVQFYKDGYTDLRGRFDYTSLSTNELDHVSKFSLLVYSDQHGALVREASPPKQ